MSAPTQKTGMEMPIRARTVKNLSEKRPARTAV